MNSNVLNTEYTGLSSSEKDELLGFQDTTLIEGSEEQKRYFTLTFINKGMDRDSASRLAELRTHSFTEGSAEQKEYFTLMDRYKELLGYS